MTPEKNGTGRAAALLMMSLLACSAEETRSPVVPQSLLAEDTHLFSSAEGNLVIFNGAESVVIAGVLSPVLVDAAVREMGLRRERPVYVIAMPSDSAVSYGDGSWGARGGTTIAPEHLRSRIAKRFADSPSAPMAVPVIGFSKVIQLYPAGVVVHAVVQEPGSSDNDLSVHFHSSAVLMLGNIFTVDGYPAIDTVQGGSFPGLLETATWFAENFGEDAVVVPARGPAVSGRDLREYVTMLQLVRSRVEPLVVRGRSLADIIAAQPLADLQERWGSGPISSSEFLTTVHHGLRSQRSVR